MNPAQPFELPLTRGAKQFKWHQHGGIHHPLASTKA